MTLLEKLHLLLVDDYEYICHQFRVIIGLLAMTLDEFILPDVLNFFVNCICQVLIRQFVT